MPASYSLNTQKNTPESITQLLTICEKIFNDIYEHKIWRKTAYIELEGKWIQQQNIEEYSFIKIPIYSKIPAFSYCINKEEAEKWQISPPTIQYCPRVMTRVKTDSWLELLGDLEWILLQIYRESGHGSVCLNYIYKPHKKQQEFLITWSFSYRHSHLTTG